MLLKLFGPRTNKIPPNPNPSFNGVVEKPLILQIIHPGGLVERYYMAFPAASIIEKYPNFVLTRPEIFRRPWDSIVPPEETLVPGKKYFVVPIRTVKKLRRRMYRPSIEMPNSEDNDTSCSRSSLVYRPKSSSRRVRFKGIESRTRNDSGGKKSSNGKELIKKKKKKNVRFSSSLTMIDEAKDFDD